MLFCMAEYCDTLQSKEERNREYKLCLSKGTIVHLLDGFSSPIKAKRGGIKPLNNLVLEEWLSTHFSLKPNISHEIGLCI